LKTIIHITLSNLERSHLANFLDDRYSSRMVSRDEVTKLCENAVHVGILHGKPLGEINNGNENGTSEPAAGSTADEVTSVGLDSGGDRSIPGQLRGETIGGEPQPGATELAAACKRVLNHIALNQDDDCVNVGYCASILLATGIH